MVRSVGDANLRNSLAARNYEEARSRNLDNRLKYAETYFAKRRANEDYKESMRKPVTSEQLFRMRQSQKPKRLATTQLDPVTGRIDWPVLLQKEDFDQQRAELEKLFAARASHDHISLDDYTKIQQAYEKMQEQLSEIIKDVPPQDYVRAKSFLKSLAYECSYSPVSSWFFPRTARDLSRVQPIRRSRCPKLSRSLPYW